MKCKGFDKLIFLFLDGRLDRGREKELKDHLSGCERCARKLVLLESAEEGARKIEAKEPPREYWDTFSGRVMEKIDARKEGAPVSGMNKILGGIFTYSHFRLKVAAGLVSIALVLVVGKMYVDHRGREIIPSETVSPADGEKRHEIDVGGWKKHPPADKAGKRGESAPEKRGTGGEPAATAPKEEKDLLPGGAEGEKNARPVEEKRKAPAGVTERLPAPAPALQDAAPTETGKTLKEQAISPEASRYGTDAVKKAGEAAEAEAPGAKDKANVVEQLFSRMETRKFPAGDTGAPDAGPPARALALADHYMVSGTSIPKIDENDTLMREDELRELIQVWKSHIEENPLDSLSLRGYLQVATAYYLLARLGADPSVVSEGLELIEGYLDRAGDPALRDSLRVRLEDIKESGHR